MLVVEVSLPVPDARGAPHLPLVTATVVDLASGHVRNTLTCNVFKNEKNEVEVTAQHWATRAPGTVSAGVSKLTLCIGRVAADGIVPIMAPTPEDLPYLSSAAVVRAMNNYIKAGLITSLPGREVREEYVKVAKAPAPEQDARRFPPAEADDAWQTYLTDVKDANAPVALPEFVMNFIACTDPSDGHIGTGCDFSAPATPIADDMMVFSSADPTLHGAAPAPPPTPSWSPAGGAPWGDIHTPSSANSPTVFMFGELSATDSEFDSVLGVYPAHTLHATMKADTRKRARAFTNTYARDLADLLEDGDGEDAVLPAAPARLRSLLCFKRPAVHRLAHNTVESCAGGCV